MAVSEIEVLTFEKAKDGLTKDEPDETPVTLMREYSGDRSGVCFP